VTNEVDKYIAAAPKAAQPHLRALRAIIREEAPSAEEVFSYRMPSYTYLGKLMYFAAFKSHVGLYPVGNADKHLGMGAYMTGKGTYQFPLDRPLPERDIRRLVRTRVKENEAKAGQKAGHARPAANVRSASRAGASASRRASRS
jgi:uncharacterized protein YdhG (YjbR/CyaY superfamily)